MSQLNGEKKFSGDMGLPASVNALEPGKKNIGRVTRDTTKSSKPLGSATDAGGR